MVDTVASVLIRTGPAFGRSGECRGSDEPGAAGPATRGGWTWGERRGSWSVPGVLAIGLQSPWPGVRAARAARRDDRGRRSSASSRAGDVLRPRRSTSAPSPPKSGPLGSDFGGLPPGIEAYFNTVNAKGGVNGRKIVARLQPRRRRATQPVHPARPHPDRPGPRLRGDGGVLLVHPGLLRETKTPTYGYNVSGNWPDRAQPVRRGRLDPGLLRRCSRRYATSSRRPRPKSWRSSATGRPSPRPTTPATPAADGMKAAGVQRELRGRRRPARRELLLGRPADAAGRLPLGRHLHAGHRTTSPWPGPSSSTGSRSSSSGSTGTTRPCSTSTAA